MWKAKKKQEEQSKKFENWEGPPTMLGRLARLAKKNEAKQNKSDRIVLRASFRLAKRPQSASHIKQKVLGSQHAKMFDSLVGSQAYQAELTSKRNTAKTESGFSALPGQRIKTVYEPGVLPRYPVFHKVTIVALTTSRLVVDYALYLKPDKKTVEEEVEVGNQEYVKRKVSRTHRKESLRVLARILKVVFGKCSSLVEQTFGCCAKPNMMPWVAKYIVKKNTPKPSKEKPRMLSSKVEDLAWSGLKKLWLVVRTELGTSLESILQSHQEATKQKCLLKSRVPTNKVPQEVKHCYYLHNTKIFDCRNDDLATKKTKLWLIQADLVAPVVGNFDKQKHNIVNKAVKQLTKEMHAKVLDVKHVESIKPDEAPTKNAWALCKYEFAKVDMLDVDKYQDLFEENIPTHLNELTTLVQNELQNFKVLAYKFDYQKPDNYSPGNYLASSTLSILAKTDFQGHVDYIASTKTKKFGSNQASTQASTQATKQATKQALKKVVEQAAKRIHKEANKHALRYAKSSSTNILITSIDKVGFSVF